MPHPLAQATVADDPDSGSENYGTPSSAPTPVAWTPSPGYESDRASIISTASSHDLTTHARANASFDPLMGAGANGMGVGRFNANKLNSYLHSLNRRLQEENEVLVERLKALEDSNGTKSQVSGSISASSTERRPARRVSAGPSGLGDVEEEGWAEERKELEEMVDELKAEVDTGATDRENLERALQDALEERDKEKLRWKERTAEIQSGVEDIIRELESKIAAAYKRAEEAESKSEEQARQSRRELEDVTAARTAAEERATRAEAALESNEEPGKAMKEANDRVEHVLSDLRNANAQIRELEDEVLRSDGVISELEGALSNEKAVVEKLRNEATDRDNKLKAATDQVDAAFQDLADKEAFTAELEEAADAAIHRIETLEEEVASANTLLEEAAAKEEHLQEQIRLLETNSARSVQVREHTEEALEAAERKMREDAAEIARLKASEASMHRTLQREREKLASRLPNNTMPSLRVIEMEGLEEELEEAHKEIARLTSQLSQSPARRAIERARDVKIEALEKEKDELAERLRTVRESMQTPHRRLESAANMAASPVHRRLLDLQARTPKTPGAPLRDVSPIFAGFGL